MTKNVDNDLMTFLQHIWGSNVNWCAKCQNLCEDEFHPTWRFAILRSLVAIFSCVCSSALQGAGFPPSWKIRGKYSLLESQGISIFFIEGQGKSGNFDLAYVNQILPYISRFIFVKPYVCRYKIFPHFAWIFIRYLLDSCLEVRESQGKWPRNVRESQGIQIELTGGNPREGPTTFACKSKNSDKQNRYIYDIYDFIFIFQFLNAAWFNQWQWSWLFNFCHKTR